MVLQIEKLSPSDFGRHGSLFEHKKEKETLPAGKHAIKKLYKEYRNGLVDSVTFHKRLEKYIEQL